MCATELLDNSDHVGANIPEVAPVVYSLSYRLVKRVIDLAGSILGILILLPLLVLVAILIKLTSPGPIIYAYDEIGLSGKRFRCYKFRTMVIDADNQFDSLKNLNEMTGPVFKLSRDPRITKLGVLLRKYSIDELPQLWCVIKGDMSIVGPRPALPREWEQYRPWQRRRLSVTPGITGMWQAYGRNQVDDFDQWVQLDLDYIDNWSVWLDIKIMFRTVIVVLRGTGI